MLHVRREFELAAEDSSMLLVRLLNVKRCTKQFLPGLVLAKTMWYPSLTLAMPSTLCKGKLCLMMSWPERLA